MKLMPLRTSSALTRTVATLLTGAGILLGLSACGGSSPQPPTGGASAQSAPSGGGVGFSVSPARTSSSQVTPSVVQGTESSKRLASEPNGTAVRDPVSKASGPSHARTPAGSKDDEVRNGAAPLNPCALVGAAQASTILGRSHVNVQLAPQGPTCIYSAPGKPAAYVTTSVGMMNLAVLRHVGRTVTHFRFGGRTGYCIRYGTLMTVVGLPGGRVLKVSGSCQITAQFASDAMKHF